MEEIGEQVNVMKAFHEASPAELYAEAEWQDNPTDVGVIDSNCEEKRVHDTSLRIGNLHSHFVL